MTQQPVVQSHQPMAVQSINGLSLTVTNLMPALPERGKIKIGEKGQTTTSGKGTSFQPPRKLDHFRVVTLLRGQDGNFLRDEAIHQKYGDKPTVLPVRLVYDALELNFQSRYCRFDGKRLACAGDGRQALFQEPGKPPVMTPCPCGKENPEYKANDRCKISGVLSCLIDGVAGIGGVYKLRTTSWNSVRGIHSSLALISAITGGYLAGIPLHLCLSPKTGTTPDGQQVLVHIVHLEFPGDMEALRDTAYKIALGREKQLGRIRAIEEIAQAQLTQERGLFLTSGETEADVCEEFYPEQAVVEVVDPLTGEVLQGQAPSTVQGAAVAMPAGDSAMGSAPAASQSPSAQVAPGRHAAASSAGGRQSGQSGKSTKASKEPASSPAAERVPSHQVKLPDGREVSTCGVTADQLVAISGAWATGPNAQQTIREALAAIGHEHLTFFTEDEAASLLAILEAQARPAPATVVCPMSGKNVEVEGHCMTVCEQRRKDGFCPVVDDVAEPGESGNSEETGA